MKFAYSIGVEAVNSARPLKMSWPAKGDEHGMLNVVEEGVAVADAFQRELRRERNDFGQARMRAPRMILHVGGKERA